MTFKKPAHMYRGRKLLWIRGDGTKGRPVRLVEPATRDSVGFLFELEDGSTSRIPDSEIVQNGAFTSNLSWGS